MEDVKVVKRIVPMYYNIPMGTKWVSHGCGIFNLSENLGKMIYSGSEAAEFVMSGPKNQR